uniref:Uncharacterized protein n=1 Tax=Arundo donax TaxID=35708 RepID=A0A0A8ZRU9_ARUDO
MVASSPLYMINGANRLLFWILVELLCFVKFSILMLKHLCKSEGESRASWRIELIDLLGTFDSTLESAIVLCMFSKIRQQQSCRFVDV